MRGKPSVLFLFKQYLQNTLFFVAADPGRSRYLAMMFMMAGISGLPFAEDAMDLLDALLSSTKKSDVRLALKEHIREIGLNPDFILHGGMRGAFGTDITGSLSMGKIVPGASAIKRQAEDRGDLRSTMLELTMQVGGPVPTIPLQAWQALTSDSPNGWREE
jgi:hypothetical protein